LEQYISSATCENGLDVDCQIAKALDLHSCRYKIACPRPLPLQKRQQQHQQQMQPLLQQVQEMLVGQQLWTQMLLLQLQ
jgi:hypothetical protein